MTIDFKHGAIVGLIPYGVGALITTLVHLIFGWDYPHSAPTAFLPLFVTLAVGTARLLSTSFKFYTTKSIKAKGELMIHVSVAVIVFLFWTWMSYGFEIWSFF